VILAVLADKLMGGCSLFKNDSKKAWSSLTFFTPGIRMAVIDSLLAVSTRYEKNFRSDLSF
jgi:hypothetical protein